MAIFSSNYTLYGSLSNRVMSMLSHYSPRIDQYSIDESFFEADESMAKVFFREHAEDHPTLFNKITIDGNYQKSPIACSIAMAPKYRQMYFGLLESRYP